MSIRVTAPASTANLGPGFDCLGAALATRLHVEAGAQPTTPEKGPRSEPSELLLRAVRLVGSPPGPDWSVEVHEAFPSGRGLGFSAAEIAAGLLIGCALSGRDPDPAELLRIGLELEGHPDNLAPALYGGLTLSMASADGWDVQCFAPAPGIRPCIAVPRNRLATAQARKVLPEQVPLTDAVRNVAAAAGLVSLLSGQQEPTRERLLACTEDRLHQPYRASLMPETARLIETLREAGLAAAVSGAGPSVVCLLLPDDIEAFRDIVSHLEGWRTLEPDWDLEGARIIEA